MLYTVTLCYIHRLLHTIVGVGVRVGVVGVGVVGVVVVGVVGVGVDGV